MRNKMFHICSIIKIPPFLLYQRLFKILLDQNEKEFKLTTADIVEAAMIIISNSKRKRFRSRRALYSNCIRGVCISYFSSCLSIL